MNTICFGSEWSAGKESICNMGDLGWEDPLEKGKAIHSSILAWRIPRGRKELDRTEQLSLSPHIAGFPAGASGKEPICQCRKHKRQEIWF